VSRAVRRTRPRPPEKLTATIQIQGHELPFQLYSRPLRLGPYGVVQYYWMDGSQFRAIKSEASAANFRNCIGHWAGAMRASGLGDDLDQQINYILAVAYALVSSDKGPQKIYRDSFLGQGRTDPTSTGLSDEDRLRIRRIVASHDRSQVHEELDRVLGRFRPPDKVLPSLQLAFARWVGRGVSLMLRDGNDGLENFLNEIKYWMARLRKKGGHVWCRHFLNMFAYEAKVSFYTCYANTWVDLVPWLKQHRGLDELSERFLRLWHNQNQPIEIPHDHNSSGLYYPTHGRAATLEPGNDGGLVHQSTTWQTKYLGPTHIADVFSGQVLSLHPLSGFFMKDPALCAIAGRFLTSERYDVVMTGGRSENCPEYWELVGAILSAANLYRIALDNQAQQRGICLHGGDLVETLVAGPDEGSEANLLEDFAAAHGIVCPNCGGPVTSNGYTRASLAGIPGKLHFSCRSCGCEVPAVVDRSAFQDWFFPPED
jgi:hypothetical protein